MIKRLTRSASLKNAATSYLAFVSTAAWGLITIPVAVTYLSKEQLGLWAVVNAVLSYIAYCDLGIGPATGRLFATAVASGDQTEINRWWTATRVILWGIGILIIALGLTLIPLLLPLFKLSPELEKDAQLLLVGGIIITGLSMPMRGIAGILIAQHRYHWIPLIQATAPWINFITFFAFISNGWGLKSYLLGITAGQVANWLAFSTLIRINPIRPRNDLHGIQAWRYREMLKLSGNMGFVGLVQALQQSLPNMLIARLGGLAAVPLYHFSSRGPMLGGQLVTRSYQSLYPSLQRHYVSGHRILFKTRHQTAGTMILGIGIIGAAGVLAINRCMVELLAMPSMFVGNRANVWLAVSMVTLPIATYFQGLLPISGNMSFSWLVALFRIATILLGSVLLWPHFGYTGIAASFALAPLVDTAYGYFQGSRNCGFHAHQLSLRIAIATLASVILILLAGQIQQGISDPGTELTIRQHIITLPGPKELLIPAAVAGFGMLTLWSSWSRHRLDVPLDTKNADVSQ